MPSEYELAFFGENGFTREVCPSCGRPYWSQGAHSTCGETPCQEYEFIGHSPMKRELELPAMRETFLRFFENEGHPRIRRYPVVARWRNDVFYTQASIYPFQPWVIEGLAEPPANPLGISQPCVRFNDLDNVGKTGQHFSLFEMMAHHAFNAPKRVYFKERTTELCHRFLTEELGIEAPSLRYAESWWAGGGYSGPSFEVTVSGAEVATLVFMMFRGEEKGGEPLKGPVVDTGYGLERLTWVSKGSPSAYEAVFGDVLETLKGDAGIQTDERVLAEYSKVAGGMSIETHGDVRRLRSDVANRLGLGVEELTAYTLPLEYVYALTDHARALAFVLGDGVVPSNMKEGYFARLLVRRSLRALDRLEIDRGLSDILSLQIGHFAKDFPELREWEEEILKLAEVEAAKYVQTLKRGRRIVRDREAGLSKGKNLSTEDLVELYDSHGLVPEVVQEFAKGKVEVPDDFFTQVADRHLEVAEERREGATSPPDFPPTRLRYYEDPKRFVFEATFLGTSEGGVVLDETYFYPEGGGQEPDHGTIGEVPVNDVQLVGGVAVHMVPGKVSWKKGDRVEGHIDEGRRMRLLRHHTATHLVNGAARQVLGRHVWQTGAHKSEDRATLDITHYQGLTRREVQAIETLANRIVLEDRPVHQHFVPREEAEAHHGFILYQGGSIPGRDIRVVDVEDFDVEGCGGTHALHTGEVGLIKIYRSRRIQDGVVRLEFVAGEAALDRFRQRERTLEEASEILRTKPDELPTAADRLVTANRELSAKVERAERQAFAQEVEELLAGAEDVGGTRLVIHLRMGSSKDLVALAQGLLRGPGVVGILGSRDGTASILIGRSDDVSLDAREAIETAAELLGGRGGGKPDLAQGGGPQADRLEEALAEAEARVRALLRG
ncbi:MAG: alanine--tRNA ligase [Candidatus Thermoplasmatota archaeon]|nr:alanine--tRNA ligase [Candidatus Thermoplasmatota archaeon]